MSELARYLDLWFSPINVVLYGTLAIVCYIAWQAQRRPDFDWSSMLQNDNGKLSAFALAAMGSFAVSSWVIMKQATGPTGVSNDSFALYLLTWSSSAATAKLIDAWGSKGNRGYGGGAYGPVAPRPDPYPYSRYTQPASDADVPVARPHHEPVLPPPPPP